MKLKIGITGQDGFVGKHLYNTLGLSPDKFERIPFERGFFQDTEKMNTFVASCDVIVHLAAMNRNPDPNFIYQTNISLVATLVTALDRTGSKAHVLFSSSSQEDRDNLYGQSKKEGRQLLIDWARESGGLFTGLIIPNVFGPFCKANYNSVVATFCDKLINNQTPQIQVDAELQLIYVGELVDSIIRKIESRISEFDCQVPHTSVIKVSEILNLLITYKDKYIERGTIPKLSSIFETYLFNTFRSYIDHQSFFPVKHTKFTDNRGVFSEVIRTDTAGQFSYSITYPEIVRGNHFHTRKVERFSVIKGKALIKLRKIGTDEIISFHLDGNEPSYVDMPVWYTHNIINVGDEDLYTLFWINEFYNPADPDTFFENV